jgi:hypothetical protein
VKKIYKITRSLLLSTMLSLNGCFILNKIIHRSVDIVETVANDKIDSFENDVQARLNGKLIDANLNTQFQLAYDQTVAISGTGLRLKFSTIIEESRCAYDIKCNRVGQVTVLLMASRNGAYLGNYNLSLIQGSKDTPTKKIDIFTLKLNNVEPASFASYNRPLSNDYSVNLTIIK